MAATMLKRARRPARQSFALYRALHSSRRQSSRMERAGRPDATYHQAAPFAFDIRTATTGNGPQPTWAKGWVDVPLAPVRKAKARATPAATPSIDNVLGTTITLDQPLRQKVATSFRTLGRKSHGPVYPTYLSESKRDEVIHTPAEDRIPVLYDSDLKSLGPRQAGPIIRKIGSVNKLEGISPEQKRVTPKRVLASVSREALVAELERRETEQLIAKCEKALAAAKSVEQKSWRAWKAYWRARKTHDKGATLAEQTSDALAADPKQLIAQCELILARAKNMLTWEVSQEVRSLAAGGVQAHAPGEPTTLATPQHVRQIDIPAPGWGLRHAIVRDEVLTKVQQLIAQCEQTLVESKHLERQGWNRVVKNYRAIHGAVKAGYVTQISDTQRLVSECACAVKDARALARSTEGVFKTIHSKSYQMAAIASQTGERRDRERLVEKCLHALKVSRAVMHKALAAIGQTTINTPGNGTFARRILSFGPEGNVDKVQTEESIKAANEQAIRRSRAKRAAQRLIADCMDTLSFGHYTLIQEAIRLIGRNHPTTAGQTSLQTMVMSFGQDSREPSTANDESHLWLTPPAATQSEAFNLRDLRAALAHDSTSDDHRAAVKEPPIENQGLGHEQAHYKQPSGQDGLVEGSATGTHVPESPQRKFLPMPFYALKQPDRFIRGEPLFRKKRATGKSHLQRLADRRLDSLAFQCLKAKYVLTLKQGRAVHRTAWQYIKWTAKDLRLHEFNAKELEYIVRRDGDEALALADHISRLFHEFTISREVLDPSLLQEPDRKAKRMASRRAQRQALARRNALGKPRTKASMEARKEAQRRIKSWRKEHDKKLAFYAYMNHPSTPFWRHFDPAKHGYFLSRLLDNTLPAARELEETALPVNKDINIQTLSLSQQVARDSQEIYQRGQQLLRRTWRFLVTRGGPSSEWLRPGPLTNDELILLIRLDLQSAGSISLDVFDHLAKVRGAEYQIGCVREQPGDMKMLEACVRVILRDGRNLHSKTSHLLREICSSGYQTELLLEDHITDPLRVATVAASVLESAETTKLWALDVLQERKIGHLINQNEAVSLEMLPAYKKYIIKCLDRGKGLKWRTLEELQRLRSSAYQMESLSDNDTRSPQNPALVIEVAERVLSNASEYEARGLGLLLYVRSHSYQFDTIRSQPWTPITFAQLVALINRHLDYNVLFISGALQLTRKVSSPTYQLDAVLSSGVATATEDVLETIERGLATTQFNTNILHRKFINIELHHSQHWRLLLEFKIRNAGWRAGVPFTGDKKTEIYEIKRQILRVRCVILKTQRLLRSVTARRQAVKLKDEAEAAGAAGDGLKRRRLLAAATRQRRAARRATKLTVPRLEKVYSKWDAGIPDTFWETHEVNPLRPLRGRESKKEELWTRMAAAVKGMREHQQLERRRGRALREAGPVLSFSGERRTGCWR